jgi:hypothetical protein
LTPPCSAIRSPRHGRPAYRNDADASMVDSRKLGKCASPVQSARGAVRDQRDRDAMAGRAAVAFRAAQFSSQRGVRTRSGAVRPRTRQSDRSCRRAGLVTGPLLSIRKEWVNTDSDRIPCRGKRVCWQ